MKKALITGVTGQDGSYLAELLLKKGYEVHGIVRRASLFNRSRIEHLYGKKDSKYSDSFKLHYGDLTDSSSLNRFLEKYQPDEIYNLGAQSHVAVSFQIPEYTTEVNSLGSLRLLDAIRDVGINTKLYQASSSEMFGKATESIQSESTPFHPRSPYACSKVYAYYITKNYREAYNLFACNGILFNHESPRRGENFVTRKITLSLSKIKHGYHEKLILGNLDSKRDWGYAKDFVEAMWLMLQQNNPDDFVIATGKSYSVREFVEIAAKELEFDLVWDGKGINEKGIDNNTGKTIVQISSKYFRPTEVDYLCGNPLKAKEKLNWEPKTNFYELVRLMVKADIRLAKKNKENSI